MMGGVDGVSVGILAAAGAVVLFAIVYALLRGGRGDPLERLAAWARTRGLDYVPPESERLVASFVGELDGRSVEVAVERVPRAFGNELPTRLTTITVGESRRSTVCALQPAEWVLDRDGREVGERVPSGDATFDGKWSARGNDPDAVALLVTAPLRERLLEADAEGLIVELAIGSVAIPMPGVCADPRELDRRLALALALAQAIGPAPMD
ncbi:MAG: hypothetical protein HGA51_07070 [Demequinaceae bacterium]|nr:hypothetical protein [Demequinaceae bacterium]